LLHLTFDEAVARERKRLEFDVDRLSELHEPNVLVEHDRLGLERAARRYDPHHDVFGRDDAAESEHGRSDDGATDGGAQLAVALAPANNR
jgi:hypothetical protein